MLVDGTDLDRWADTMDAEGRLPQVVRRLVLASTPTVHSIEFRAGEGVRFRGWDGLLDAQGGEPFVPEGVSRWELTTAADTSSKAQGDYDKRTKDPLGVTPSESSFVFLTVRRWAGKEEWAKK